MVFAVRLFILGPKTMSTSSFGDSPWLTVGMFAVNSIPTVALALWTGVPFAAPAILAFVVYILFTEEIHWRVHKGNWTHLAWQGALAPPQTTENALQHSPPSLRLAVWDTSNDNLSLRSSRFSEVRVYGVGRDRGLPSCRLSPEKWVSEQSHSQLRVSCWCAVYQRMSSRRRESPSLFWMFRS